MPVLAFAPPANCLDYIKIIPHRSTSAREKFTISAFEKAWTGFDLDVDKFIVHEATAESALDILRTGFFSHTLDEDVSRQSIFFYEGLKQGVEGRVYFLKPKKSFLHEQRDKGYRLEYGPHERGEKFYYVGPLLRMDGSNLPLTNGCSIRADDSLVLLSTPQEGLFDVFPRRHYYILEDMEEFSKSAASAVHRLKADLWGPHYIALREILRQGDPFTGSNLETMIEHLPIEMKNMNGVPQNFGHLGLDPLQHSIIALQISQTSPTMGDLKGITLGAEATCDEIARCAILYHDMGKKIEPFDPYHAEYSGVLSQFHLECMGYSATEVAVIKRLVETHDVMGKIKKGEFSCSQGYHELFIGVPDEISRTTMVKLHYEVAGADIGSIPYLHGVNLEREKEEMLRLAQEDMKNSNRL